MKFRTIVRGVVAAGGALLVTACSSGGTSAPKTDSGISVHAGPGNSGTSADAPDACALVTDSEVSALFGYPANASTAPDDGSCAWNAVRNLPDGALLRSSLVAHAYNGTSAYVEPKAAGGHRVAHVGQRAYAYKVGNSQTIESVNHGKTVVLIYAVRSMSGRPTPSVPDAAALTALARTAAARL